MNVNIVWFKPKYCLTAGPRLTLSLKRYGTYEFFSRCFGDGHVENRWNIVAFYPPGKPWWLWFISWEPAWKNLGLSFHKAPSLTV